MQSRPRASGLILLPPLVVAVCFSGLWLRPGALLVDGVRPVVDHAHPSRNRGVGNDLTFVFLPRYAYILDRLRIGERLPFWDRSGFGGRPLVGNPQAGLFYPPVWGAWWRDSPAALGWLTVAHLIGAGLGVYVLGRELGLSPPAASVAGCVFEVSPYLMAHVNEGHYPHVWSVSWYPWAFWAFSRMRKGGAAGLMCLPVFLAFCFLSGHPQEWYLLVVALSVWAGLDSVALVRAGETRRAGVALGRWAGLIGLCLAFCAIELLPEIAAGEWLHRGSTFSLRMVNHYQVQPLNLFQLLSPFALGRPHDYIGQDNYWETVLSVGMVPLLLAFIGSVHCREPARGWVALAVVCLVVAAGRRLGLYSLAFQVLPGMNRFRVPARTLFLASLASSVLVGIGIDALRSASLSIRAWERTRRRIVGGLLSIAVVLLATAVVQKFMPPCSPPVELPPALRPVVTVSQPWAMADFRGWHALGAVGREPSVWLAILGTLGLFGLVPAGMRGRRLLGLGLGLLAVAEVSATARGVLTYAPADGFVAAEGVARRLQLWARDSSGPRRVASVPGGLDDLVAARSGLEKTNVNDGFQIQNAANLYERLYPFLEEGPRYTLGDTPMDAAVGEFRAFVARTVLDHLSVAGVVTVRPRPELGLGEALEETTRHGRVWVAHNPSALPRAFVVPRASAVLRAPVPIPVQLSLIDPRKLVLMKKDPLPDGERQPFTPAEWLGHDPDGPIVRVTTQHAGLLLVGNTWMPGWYATVDGRPEKVLRGNGWLQVVPLRSGGTHTLYLRYTPPGLRAGATITGLSLTAWAVAGILLAGPRRQKAGKGTTAF